MKMIVAFLSAALLTLAPVAQADPSEFGVSAFSADLSTKQAGAHPDFTTTIKIKTDPGSVPFAPTKSIEIDLPPGLIGNPEAFPRCTAAQLASSGTFFGVKDDICPQDSQVGVSVVTLFNQGGPQGFVEPVYNMAPPGGDVVARLGFMAEFFPTFVDVRLVPERDYGLTATVEGVGSLIPLVSATTTLWGLPAHPSHDPQRITPAESLECSNGGACSPGRPSGLTPPVPFMTNPTHCGVQRELTLRARSYADPSQVSTAVAPLPDVTGCGLLEFKPEISFAPTTTDADSPSGVDSVLSVPQEGLLQANLRATPHLKKAVVTLPRGLALNPAAAGGLAACTEAQIGLVSERPIRFNAAPPRCPAGSKVGSAEIRTPVLPEPLEGSLYLASQADNPFEALLSGYLVAEGQGVMLKVAGRFDADPVTGQLTATFDDNPEQPFGRLELRFKGGSRGVVITPPACGSYAIQSTLSPWSALDPSNPSPSESVESTDSFAIGSGPNGSACPSGQFSPRLDAGTTRPVAGAFSPFVLRLSRDDGTQRLSGVSVSLPPGLVGKLVGIPRCSDAALASIPSALGTGAGQLLAGACPAASQVGTVQAGAGAGPTPFFVNTGRAYLAGPYKGAPLSLAIAVPAVAGPFDLGNVVVRTALRVDPRTTRIAAISDPLPTVVHGIPLALRDVRVIVDRSGFILNPTSCRSLSFAGTAISEQGLSAPLAERFQVDDCDRLGFKPKLGLRLLGKPGRTAYQGLRATLTARRGDANIAAARVTLPDSALLAQEHIKTVCTRVQFAADKCPKASIYGRARATSPLLADPLRGPVYLRSSSNLLPDLVAALKGPASLPIEVELSGRTDAVDGALRNSFDFVPDVPVAKFALELFGGERGLIVNSRNLCGRTHRATVLLRAQSGKRLTIRPVVKNSCGKQRKRKSAAPTKGEE